MHRLKAKKAIILVAAIAAVSAVGLVYAAWTSNGSGSAYAEAATAVDLTTVDVSASTAATLYPGAAGNVAIKISNPNPYPVRVTNVNGNGTITPDATHAACTTTGVTFSNQSGLSIDIAANGATQVTLTGAASMSNASVDGCQGATFTVPVALTGLSNAT